MFQLACCRFFSGISQTETNEINRFLVLYNLETFILFIMQIMLAFFHYIY